VKEAQQKPEGSQTTAADRPSATESKSASEQGAEEALMTASVERTAAGRGQAQLDLALSYEFDLSSTAA
jgi:hypothetical protein